MNEPHPGAPDNYSGQPTPEPYSAPPAQPPGPPEPYSTPPTQPSGPPAATYEPTRQYPAQPPYATGQATPQYGAPSYGPSDSHGQPSPGYGQPSSGYAQSDGGYGQPGPYGQPPYQSGYGSAPYAYTAPAKSGLSTTTIVLIVLAVVIVIGGGAGVFLATRSSTSTPSAAPAAPATTSPSTGSPTTAPPSTPPPSSTAGANSIFTLPKTAAGMTLSPNSGLGDLMSKSLPDSVAGSTTTGLYTDPGNPAKILILIGTQTKLGNPDVAVIGAFTGIAQSPTIKLKSPKSYDAGSLGGAMECASGSLSELGQSIPVGVCAVGDSKGLILTIFTSRSASSAASATRKLRPSFEHR